MGNWHWPQYTLLALWVFCYASMFWKGLSGQTPQARAISLAVTVFVAAVINFILWAGGFW